MNNSQKKNRKNDRAIAIYVIKCYKHIILFYFYSHRSHRQSLSPSPLREMSEANKEEIEKCKQVRPVLALVLCALLCLYMGVLFETFYIRPSKEMLVVIVYFFWRFLSKSKLLPQEKKKI